MRIESDGKPPPVTLIYQPPSFFERLNLTDMFACARPVEVELGCGDSTLIAQLARENPDHNFLGVERLMGRIRKLDRKGRRSGLSNLRGLRIEAGYCLEWLLPFQSVSAIHVYFPDPWPKRKHWPRRLVNNRFPELAAKCLVLGGMVHLRTDDLPYFIQMTQVFAVSHAFRKAETPTELASILTDFERDFLARGKVTYRAAYQRVRTNDAGTVKQ